ncbi:MAG: glycosyltransferase family 1 protein [Candidatus Moraniibacteriota bacterium]
MRIGIDARTILNPKEGEAIGAGHYTYQLLKNILEIDRENEYVIFFDFRAREKDVKKFTLPNVKIIFYPFSDYYKYLPGAYNEVLTASTLAKEKLDLLHSTSPSSRIPTTYKGKTIVTFHNLSIYKIPECHPRARFLRNKVSYQMMVKKADKIIAVSESIKKDLEEIFGEGDKTEVVYGGFDRRFLDDFETGSERVLGKLGIENKYILFLGTLEPSKNVTRILEAFARFKKKMIVRNKKENKNYKFDYQLLLVGKRGWLAGEYPQIAQDLGIEKEIVFAGYIIGDEILPIMKKAEFLLLPSLYEGFGTTVLEAFGAGLPAMISDIPSLREIAGEAAYFVNPIDIEEMSEAMVNFSQDSGLRSELRERGLKRAEDFSWEKTARETLEIYKKII